MHIDLSQLQIQPNQRKQELRDGAHLAQYQYLDDLAKIGHALWYAITHRHEWVALLSFPPPHSSGLSGRLAINMAALS